MRRAIGFVAVAALVVLAVAVQLTVLSRLDLPAATPDLVLVAVAALGAVRGSSIGAVAGFGGGLLLDLAPPADHPAGQWALVLTVVGYAAGRLASDPGVAAVVRGVVVGLLAGVGTLGYVVLSAVLGQGWPGVTGMGTLVAASAAYAWVLAVAVLPVTGWAADRLGSSNPRW